MAGSMEEEEGEEERAVKGEEMDAEVGCVTRVR